MDFKKEIKELQSLITQLKNIQTPKKTLNDFQLAEKLQKARSVAMAITLSDLIAQLEQQEFETKQKITASLDERREKLLFTARDAGTPHKRFGEYDRVGVFKVMYKGRKVRVEIGSEMVCQLDETDGGKIYHVLKHEMEQLESSPFEREEFFKTIKEAYHLARVRDEVRDSWAPVRTVYIYTALLRNLQFDDFLKKPATKKFRDYSTAQFVYDLARFGRRGWSVGGEVLQSQTPNMATTAAGKTIALPDLDSLTGMGSQFAVLKVSKKGG